MEDENRIIDVYWYDEAERGSYIVEIEVFATDRNGLLREILKQIENADVKLIGVNTRTTKEKIAIMNISLQTSSRDELHKAVNQIKKVEGVYDIKRKRG